MLVDVSEKVVVITGASKGIGKAIVTAFAREQAKVVINYFESEAAANQLYEEIILFNQNCISVKADITKPHDVSKLYHETLTAFGRVDILINNAGICDDSPIQLMLVEQM